MTVTQDVAPEAFGPGELALPEPRPWGLWATLGLSLAIYLMFLVGQGAVIAAFLMPELAGRSGSDLQSVNDLLGRGDVVLSALAISGTLGAALVLLFARMRRGLAVRDYLSLMPVGAGTLLAWLGLTLLVLALYHLVAMVVEPQDVTGMYLRLYETAGHPILFWIAIVIVAPVFEELFFRGFMFRGLRESRLGDWGAVAITSLLWAVIHFQYDAKLIGVIFALGLFLGVARVRRGSVLLTIALHAAINLIAGLEILLLSGGFGV